ncbi:flagellar basal body-associated FliL family protein [Geomonas oryzae]|uniref:flagellar basal body-associated FliL family protein n=1 Tax=Geomonas oryzae TaxID=2364273 RepID=UPI00100BDEC3|nr:flagellar basal body-associated FliL family protein [Geomonas oryzae]
MAEPAKAPETPEKNNKKLFIIIGAVVAVLAIGGAAAFFMGGGKKAKAPEGAKVEAKAEGGGEHGAPAKEGGEGGGAVGGTIYPLEPFIVNIYDGQELRYLKIKVEFEMANPQAKAELDAKLAPLRDAILILLTTKTMQEIQDLQGKNQLREQILAAVSKVVPPSKITKVYFTDFVVQ